MIDFLKLITELINNVHDLFMNISSGLNLNYNDKQLHFIVIGIIGILIFFITDLIFKWLSRYNISIISFIYTATILLVLVFALEIEQKITGRGRMEFEDIVAGIWGFMWFFLIYLAIRVLIYIIKKIFESVSSK